MSPIQYLTVPTYRVTKIIRNPRVGWEMFKIESKKMRDICFLKFGNTVTSLVTHYAATDGFCNVYSVSVSFPKFGFRFILVTLYERTCYMTQTAVMAYGKIMHELPDA
jgi:hypothetical protein